MSYINVKCIAVALSCAFLCFPVYLATKTQSKEENLDKGVNHSSISALRFPSVYHVVGTIQIPSASIVEPFEAWYAGKYNRSRIDYYGGTVKTFQRADVGKYGTLYEIIPKYDYRHNSHYQGCWKKAGKQKKKIEPQNVLPQNVYWPFKMNLAQYKFNGTVTFNGTLSTKWVANIEAYNKTDTYVFYASDEPNPKPVKFEMKGYDILLTSYYDHYIVSYSNFTPWQYDPLIFNIPQVARRDQWCRKLPKNIGEAGYRNINPMQEFLDREEYEGFGKKFESFKDSFGKNYQHEKEHRKRMHIARHNMRYIHSINRRELGYKLDVNHFTDLTEEEFKTHKGTLFDDNEDANEFERQIPVIDENTELSDKDAGEFMWNQPNVNNLKAHMSSQNMKWEDRNIASASSQVSNVEETNTNEVRDVIKRNHNNSEIQKNGKDNKSTMKTDDISQGADYTKDGENIEAGDWRNVTNAGHKRSEIIGKSFETELKELAFFGKKLDELSNQLNRKEWTNSIDSKNIVLEQKSLIKKENTSYNGTAAKYDALLRGVVRPAHGVESNKGTSRHGVNRTLAGTKVVHETNDIAKETSNGGNVSKIEKQRIGIVPRDHYDKQSPSRGSNDEKHSKTKLIEQTGVKRGKLQESFREKKKGSKSIKEQDAFAIDTTTFQPIAGKALYRLIDEEVLRQMQQNKENFGELYTPKMAVRKIHNNLITFRGSSLKKNEYDGSRRSLNTKSSMSNDFDKTWTMPKSSNVEPFFMFGVDHRGAGITQIDTLESDFFMNDDYRFPKEFQFNYFKRNGRLLRRNPHKKKKKKTKIPMKLDWRDYGALSPIQSQGICGSCWSFSTAAAVESAHFLKTGELVKLSEQQLLDCTWYVPHSKEGNHGCMGGWTWKSFAFIKKFGLATTKSYKRYLGMESPCKEGNYSVGATIDSFMKVAPNNAKALMKAIAMYGPATASINTEAKTLKFYKHGIYNDKICNGATDHSVLVVGYGRHKGKLYWIVRNSWGTKWGADGFIKIENGKCGLLKKPWVIINRGLKSLPWKKTIKGNQLIEI